MIVFFFFFFDETTGDTVPVPVDDRSVNNTTELGLFYDNKVRRVWHKQESKWYFSIVDVCSVLTDSSSPSSYWRKLKQRLVKSGNETVTNCHSLKLKAADIKKRKGLKKNEQILDHMGYEELAANLFRATQAEAKLKRENIQGKENANQAHFDVGQEVRNTIKRLGGTMPEDLPTPEKSIKQIEKEQKKINKTK